MEAVSPICDVELALTVQFAFFEFALEASMVSLCKIPSASHHSPDHLALVVVSLMEEDLCLTVRLVGPEGAFVVIAVFLLKDTLALSRIQMKLSFIGKIGLSSGLCVVLQEPVAVHLALQELTFVNLAI